MANKEMAKADFLNLSLFKKEDITKMGAKNGIFKYSISRLGTGIDNVK
jgi:hypothetical protein